MEKNISALLRTDARTVSVQFKDDGRLYTYVTDLAIEPDDLCLVFVNTEPKVVTVIDVHDSVLIEPGDSLKYKWIAAKIDLTRYRANMERNAEIDRVVLEKYKDNLRRSFAEQILTGLPAKDRKALQHLLKGE